MPYSTNQSEGGRLILVSNRLNVTAKRNSTGYELVASVGGLATGLSSRAKDQATVWVGWPGHVESSDQPKIQERLAEEFGSHPVFMSKRLIERFYEGYSNRTLWPVFHYFPMYASFSAQEWEAYREANELFCEKVIEIYRPGDTIWVHDSQLMLLPAMLRKRLPEAAIGFFLHIPFPHFETFRLIPDHRELLLGLLGADLIGFHTYDYAQAYLGALRRLLGMENVLGQVRVENRTAQVDVFPMGIDFGRYALTDADPELVTEVEAAKKALPGQRKILSISRLDYTKGVRQTLEAYEHFLENNPDMHEKVVYLLVVVPSRERVERYAQLKREIDGLVGRMNGKFSTLRWTPVRYVYRALSFAEIIALYQSSEVALIAPIRDGMNLVAKEYLAARNDEEGVLILSELAGAVKELNESIVVNPNHKEGISAALVSALDLPSEERRRRNSAMREMLSTHDITYWSESFLRRLEESRKASIASAVRLLENGLSETLVESYRSARKRLLLFDYDGTLVNFAARPSDAAPDSELISVIDRLARSEGNTVAIVSGRDRHSLQQWFSGVDVVLAAEHGAWTRLDNSSDWRPAAGASPQWKTELRPLLELFVKRIPGSFVEEKEYSLVWHYRLANQESARDAAGELLETLTQFTANMALEVMSGKKAIEVKSMGISKGAFIQRHFGEVEADFVLAIGDDVTDEAMFAVLPKHAYSIKVGIEASRAAYNVREVSTVRSLLSTLSEVEL